ncbi:MAG: ABC transporter substrate-binding protein [Sulfuritalea sp.]|jgi:branched-chain amino acid transport system substrate-binding protein|nr:ABC transporter substrate-binding protein [Sulfuritalea sp.]
MYKKLFSVTVFSLCIHSAHVLADITVGISLSLTGPAASAAASQKNTLALLPAKIANIPVNYIVLDDATDTTTAVTNARKFVTEGKVDVIIGSTATPGSLAISSIAAEAKTPQIALAPFDVPAEKETWSFKTPPSFPLVAKVVIDDMARRKVKTIAFLGFSDALGEVWLNAIRAAAESKNIKLLAIERYGRTDNSVLAQVLKIISVNPDAVVVGATSAAAALPQLTLKEKGFKGLIYHTHATATPEFIKMAGSKAEGALMPVVLPVVAEQLPDSHPSKAAALDFVKAYEGKYGPKTRTNFASHLWDAMLLLETAIPVALDKAKPGTEEFRSALRNAIENTKGKAVTNGVVTMSAKDHYGYDERALALVEVRKGEFVLFK